MQAHVRLRFQFPLSRHVIMQQLRPSTDNAIQAAARDPNPANLLAEFDDQAPGEALDAAVELGAIKAQAAEPASDFLADRQVFMRWFQTFDEDTSAYLDAIPAENAARSRYSNMRLLMSSQLDQMEPRGAVRRLIDISDPDTLFLHLMIGAGQLGVCVTGSEGGRRIMFGTRPLGRGPTPGRSPYVR